MPRSDAEYTNNCATRYSNEESTIPVGAMKTPHKAMKTAENRENPLKMVLLVIDH